MAAGFELPVAMMNCPGNFMAHLAAALPNHMRMEVVEGGREVCFAVDTWIEDGWIHVGATPGLGITIDEERLAAIEIDPSKPAPPDAMPFGRREGAGLLRAPLPREDRSSGLAL